MKMIFKHLLLFYFDTADSKNFFEVLIKNDLSIADTTACSGPLPPSKHPDIFLYPWQQLSNPSPLVF